MAWIFIVAFVCLSVCLSLKDLAMYINEVKRDNETLKKISEFQSSIENLVSVHEGVQYTNAERGHTIKAINNYDVPVC